MEALIIVLVVIAAALIGCLAWVSSQPDTCHTAEPPPTEAELLQARLDLHRIDRGVDLALSRHESRQAAARTKQAIADALDDHRP